jgi:hypothetical protein
MAEEAKDAAVGIELTGARHHEAVYNELITGIGQLYALARSFSPASGAATALGVIPRKLGWSDGRLAQRAALA